MWLMLQQETADDYVIATGETRSIKDFLNEAFLQIGISNWSSYIKQDPKFMRPAEVDVLRGDYSKAKSQLNWVPKTSFSEMVKKMVTNDIELIENQL
jgi:GDPmannose 4,6-dehydratase